MPTLFKFTGENASPAWEAINDGVMGGRSQGGAKLVEDGMRFSGVLSTENNGGFSSVHAHQSFDLSQYDGIRFKVLGDGRAYQLRLQTTETFREKGRVSFGKAFSTVQGEWIEVFVPFQGLDQSWHGRLLSGYSFDPGDIRRIGFLIADKKPGEFALKVRWLSAE